MRRSTHLFEIFPGTAAGRGRESAAVFWIAWFAAAAILFAPMPGAAQQDPASPGAAAGDAETPAEQPAEEEMTSEGEEPVPDPEEIPLDVPEEDSASSDLPAGYKPPGLRPPVMSIEKPLLTEEEETALRNELKLASYANMLREGRLDSESRELLKKIARYDVHRLSMQKYRRELNEIREDLSKDVRNAGLLQNNLADRDAFRAAFFDEIIARASELLDGNFYVRLNAALVLAHLDLREEDTVRGTRAVPYPRAFAPLMQIVKSDDQHQAIKIVALTGINRISIGGTLSQTDKLELADRLIAELKNPSHHPWYQMRLVETLGRIDLAVDRESRPFIVQMLTEAVADRGRHWVVRTEAAKALGRAQIPANVNLNKVVYEIAQLARDMVEGLNKKPSAFYWKHCFFNLYLAFQPLDAAERAQKFGLLQNGGQYKPLIQSAYDLVAPLTRHVIGGGGPVADGPIKQLDDWLKQNIPDNQSIAPNMPAINIPQARESRNRTR